jgi:hypothetical protein
LSAPSANPVTVRYDTTDGSATDFDGIISQCSRLFSFSTRRNCQDFHRQVIGIQNQNRMRGFCKFKQSNWSRVRRRRIPSCGFGNDFRRRHGSQTFDQ